MSLSPDLDIDLSPDTPPRNVADGLIPVTTKSDPEKSMTTESLLITKELDCNWNVKSDVLCTSAWETIKLVKTLAVIPEILREHVSISPDAI